MSDVHVCRGPSIYARIIRHCPTCGCRRRFTGGLQEWYDTVWTCCTCGDAWSPEGRMPRPFARGWRQEAARRSQSRWATATSLPDAIARLEPS